MNEPSSSTIHDSARRGDLQRLKADLQNQASCEARDEQGWTPLMTAVVSDEASVEVIALLLDCGCDINAISEARPVIDITPEVRETMEEMGMDTSSIDQVNENPPIHTPLSLAVEHAPLDKIQSLIDRGADTCWVDKNSYGMLIKALHRNAETTSEEQLEILDCLISAGCPLDTVTTYGESAIRVCAERSNTRALKLLIERGADSSTLEWNDLFYAIAFGSHDELLAAIQQAMSLEARDSFDRTPFMLAVHCGRLDMARTLLSKGCVGDAPGFRDWTALEFAIDGNHLDVMKWLIEESVCAVTNSALSFAVGLDRPEIVRHLINVGADVHELDEYGDDLMQGATSRQVIRLLTEAGLSLSSLPSDQRSAFLGLHPSQELEVSQTEYQRFRQPQFGESNPEDKSNSYWNEMVRARLDAYPASQQFGDEDCSDGRPVWCFSRFGQSMTQLPSDEVVEIAGEHEDHYDPDFCIYNDVVVHNGKGQFTIYGYPRDVFPPTDFHTATYVDGFIYIIGNLGYPDDRRPGETPVYRLNCNSWSIEPVPSSGQVPGWIHRHQAQPTDDGRILIWGGEIWDGSDSISNDWEFSFRLETGEWHRERKRTAPKKKKFELPSETQSSSTLRLAVVIVAIICGAIAIGLLIYFLGVR